MDFKVVKAENGYILKVPGDKKNMFGGVAEFKSHVATDEKALVELFLGLVRAMK